MMSLSPTRSAICSAAGSMSGQGQRTAPKRWRPALGFASVDDLIQEGSRIATDIAAGRSLTRRDWTRALLATEVVFVSNVIGSGHDWPSTTGLDDGTTLRTLRDLQLRLGGKLVRLE